MGNNVDSLIGVEGAGRFIVTFRKGAQSDGLALLRKGTGVSRTKMMSSADFGKNGVEIAQMPSEGGIVFENLGIAVVNMEASAVGALSQDIGDSGAILAIEPDGIMYAIQASSGVSVQYLQGFRDASNTLLEYANRAGAVGEKESTSEAFIDSATHTWGLQATKVDQSSYSGKGIKVAILDTGVDLEHPDFLGRGIVSKSFIPDVLTAQDGNGHGTHCTGTACGPSNSLEGRRYGVAYGAQIYIGKVLSDQGSGGDIGILAGIDWALENKCDIISMSLGANVPNTSVAYETTGERALNAGTLIVAAAGNNARRSLGDFGFVGRPANSRTFLSVGAMDANLGVGDFSARDTVRGSGTAVDLAGPGVSIYSAWPMPKRYRTISGTSMATPHVAGIAALWAQASSDRGAALWQRLITNARTLSFPYTDVGGGFVQAP